MKIAVKLLLVLALLGLTIVPACAQSVIEEYVDDYNYFAKENNAPAADPGKVIRTDSGWKMPFDTFSLYIDFDESGLSNYLMLDSGYGDASGRLAFLNAWYTADGGVEYKDIETLVSSMLGSKESQSTLYMGWYIVYEYAAATDREMLGMIWVGGTAADAAPEASPTPAPSTTVNPSTINGKPVYKA